MEALTKVGILGIKVWICKGEVYGKRDLAPDLKQQARNGREGGRRRDGGRSNRGGKRRGGNR